MESKAEQHKYSLLAKASYDNYYTGLDKTQEQLSLYPQTKGYAVNTDLTTPNHLVLVSPKEVVISYRGTDPKNVSDLTADAQILLGLDKIPINFLGRFSDADKAYQLTKKAYPDREITLTGHSLGSTQSVYVGMKNDVKSISFNEGSSPLSALFSQIITNDSAKKQKIYLTGKDLLSNFAVYQPYNTVIVPTQAFNFVAHSLSYFLPPTTDTQLPDWLLPKNKIPKYKPVKGINYANSVLSDSILYKKKKKFKAQLVELEQVQPGLQLGL